LNLMPTLLPPYWLSIFPYLFVYSIFSDLDENRFFYFWF
jgi:hypothetical protein